MTLNIPIATNKLCCITDCQLDVARSSRPGGDRDKERRIREEYEKKIERAAIDAKHVLSEELENLRRKLQALQQQCDKREDELKREAEKIRTMNQQFRKEKDDWNTKITDLEEKLRLVYGYSRSEYKRL